MKITGEIYKIFETQELSEKFKKREFVIKETSSPEYPELLKMEFINDKCTILNDY